MNSPFVSAECVFLFDKRMPWNLAKSHNPVLTIKLLFIINCKTIMFNYGRTVVLYSAATVECAWQSNFCVGVKKLTDSYNQLNFTRMGHFVVRVPWKMCNKIRAPYSSRYGSSVAAGSGGDNTMDPLFSHWVNINHRITN